MVPVGVGAHRASRLVGFATAVVLVMVFAAFTWATLKPALFPIDALAYWQAWHGPTLYTPGAIVWDAAYLYSPAFAQAIWPLAVLPWPVFAVLWSTVAFAAYAWLLAPVDAPTRAVLLVAVIVGPLAAGNIEWLLALAAVGMVRRPAWSVVSLLTKVTPGMSVFWFVGRRDWHAVGVAVGATGAIVALSFVLAPGLWYDWIALLVRNAAVGHSAVAIGGMLPVPGLLLRTVAAGALALWGGRTGRAWTIPFAMLLAQPDINLGTLGVLASIPRLVPPWPRRT